MDFSFEGNERMACQYDGEDLQIAFNARFLIEMLNGTDTDEVVMELSTPTKAGIIKPSEQSENGRAVDAGDAVDAEQLN